MKRPALTGLAAAAIVLILATLAGTGHSGASNDSVPSKNSVTSELGPNGSGSAHIG